MLKDPKVWEEYHRQHSEGRKTRSIFLMRKLSKESRNYHQDYKLATLVVAKLRLWKLLGRIESIALIMLL
jgi:hypothetical protein